ncbi:MAG: 30S ribosomal protein S8 [Candidatus Omnitrophica bacterium]|nr:30S ribosomal protein S8 [Candidatus Omnitrophota bacterium]
MALTDPIADALTIIRNGSMVKKESVDMPASKIIKSILEILQKEEYIDTFKSIEDKKQGRLKVYLKYISGKPAIINLKRISRPGLRVYVNKEEIPRVLRGKGLAIISTSAGLVTDNQAREKGVGGEVLMYIW